jgi:dTDP-4-amino-4,6-dideoxygalactose transaminase
VGAIGDIGGFSLNFHKHIHCGEGGMLVTNNKDLAFKSQLIRNHGENYAEKINKDELYNIIGGNYRLSEIHAAIGIQQLKKLEKIKKHRIKLANFLHKEIKKIDGLSTFPNNADVDHVYYLFPIKYDKKVVGISRNLFVKAVNKEFLTADGWESVPLTEGYVKPLYLNPIYQKKIAIGKKGFPFNFNEDVEYNYSKGICPNVEKAYFEELLITPLVREPLTINDMKDLITAIKKVLKYSKEIAIRFPDNSETEITTPVSISSSRNVR